MTEVQKRTCELLADSCLELGHFQEAYRLHLRAACQDTTLAPSKDAYLMLAERAFRLGFFTQGVKALARGGGSLPADAPQKLLVECGQKALVRGGMVDGLLAYRSAGIDPPRNELITCGWNRLSQLCSIEAYKCFVLARAGGEEFKACGRALLEEGWLPEAMKASTFARDEAGLVACAWKALDQGWHDGVVKALANHRCPLPPVELVVYANAAFEQGELKRGLQAMKLIGIPPSRISLVKCGYRALQRGLIGTAYRAYRMAGAAPAASDVAECGRAAYRKHRRRAAKYAFAWAAQLEQAERS